MSIHSTSVRGVITSRVGTIREPDDTGNHGALALLEHSGVMGLGNDDVELLGGDAAPGTALQPHQLEDENARPVEQPHERRHRPRQPKHRHRHERGQGLGRPQGDLLGDELADHQRGISGEHDDEHEAGGLRISGIEPQQHEALTHRRAEARPRIGAGEDADESDADLHGREKAAGIGCQVERGLRACLAGLDQRLQPRFPGRHDREFRHGEDAVQRDEQRDDGNVDPWERQQWWRGGHDVRRTV
jgi:hypothetical protein